MNQGLSLLDQALTLARQEFVALEEGAYEHAIELASQRGEMTNMAWNMLDSTSTEEYRIRLAELHSMQEQLTSLAREAHERIRSRLQNTRHEKRRMQGYHRALGQALQ
ncbi:MAG: hypothetical protein IJA79_06890 [Desulfovibrio sp.]|nr:hypothetical protein [Desulfovibrio sp.]